MNAELAPVLLFDYLSNIDGDDGFKKVSTANVKYKNKFINLLRIAEDFSALCNIILGLKWQLTGKLTNETPWPGQALSLAWHIKQKCHNSCHGTEREETGNDWDHNDYEEVQLVSSCPLYRRTRYTAGETAGWQEGRKE